LASAVDAYAVTAGDRFAHLGTAVGVALIGRVADAVGRAGETEARRRHTTRVRTDRCAAVLLSAEPGAVGIASLKYVAYTQALIGLAQLIRVAGAVETNLGVFADLPVAHDTFVAAQQGCVVLTVGEVGSAGFLVGARAELTFTIIVAKVARQA
jgi:hypothetical protein